MPVDCRESTEAGAEAASPDAAPRRRIILLSGEWRIPGSVFALEATIFAGEHGGAQGDFFWMNVDTPYAPADLVGTELVAGTAGPASLALEGYSADPQLAHDRYVIRLHGGAEGGVFDGESQAYGAWDGRLTGTYRIVEQRA